MVKKVGKYELGRSLGEGTFGKVKYAIDTETNDAVAIKILDKEKIQKQNMGNQIKKEISIMKMVKHKYIVGMIEVLASKTKIFIVLELVNGGELFDRIVQVGKLKEEQARFYFQQLVEGVEYCHKLGICHRDLKPENLLLDEHGNLKISDFGLSSLYVGDADAGNRTELLHTTCGTPNYVAPEVLSDQGYDGKKADVWSIGVILYVLLAGFLPFDEQTIVALFAKIQSADFTYPSWFTPEVRSLLDTMLVADPKTRVSIQEIKAHPWFLASSQGLGQMPLTVPYPPDVKANIVKEAIHVNNNSQDAGDDVEVVRDNNLPYDHPTSLNAFDLISRCGGFLLDKMFSPELFYKPPPLTSTSINNSSSSSNTNTGEEKKILSQSVGGNILFGASITSKTNKCYHFTANSITPIELIKYVYQALIELGFKFENSKDNIMRTAIIESTLLTVKGLIGMTIQVFELTPQLCLLEIRKGKGDILEWMNAYHDLIDNHLLNYINITM